MPGATDDMEPIYQVFEVPKPRPVVDVERLKNKGDGKALHPKPFEYFDKPASISVQCWKGALVRYDYDPWAIGHGAISKKARLPDAARSREDRLRSA
jgi:hypothetical protein